MVVKRHTYYKIDGTSAVAQKKNCPRCGPGVHMADHKDRLACGKCGYTEFKN